ncbi:toxin-antitoxin system TumE family protein [Phyllobacterium meliloti]|uniref:toxin-antitoxin system TumE family protein n=1 Tax=Phyllobacterium meliloti TaxID=555317 RepID=UPI001D144F35|nr:DUF6516 family protein [Phyllobacterium sp. T1293]UGX85416.1 DUF6516 family protein [Phyllobacterium sp. T1293]
MELALAQLTTAGIVGMIDNRRADLIYRFKSVFSDGAILEMVIWKIPTPVAGSMHLYKYRLYWGRNNERIVGYDNERGKGDHCHLDGKEHPYCFISPEALINDFYAEIGKRMIR